LSDVVSDAGLKETHVLVPDWAPNIHPLLVHFPIALLVTALAVDLVDAIRQRPGWLVSAGAWLYGAGAVTAIAAYLSGQQASTSVVVSETVRSAMTVHENWALATTGWFVLLGVMRIAVGVVAPRHRPYRLTLVGAGALGAVLLWQTSERGGRLVYEDGVGVSATPRPH